MRVQLGGGEVGAERAARAASSAVLPPGPAARSAHDGVRALEWGEGERERHELAALVLDRRAPGPDVGQVARVAAVQSAPSTATTAPGSLRLPGELVAVSRPGSAPGVAGRASSAARAAVSSSGDGSPRAHRRRPRRSTAGGRAGARRPSAIGLEATAPAAPGPRPTRRITALTNRPSPGTRRAGEVDGARDGRVRRDPGAQQLVDAQPQRVAHGRVDLAAVDESVERNRQGRPEPAAPRRSARWRKRRSRAVSRRSRSSRGSNRFAYASRSRTARSRSSASRRAGSCVTGVR